MEEKGYITALGIGYSGALPKIKKNDEKMQPVFEALTNSLEAIKSLKNDNGKITIKLFLDKTLHSDENKDYSFQKIVVEDNGIGFNEEEFARLVDLYDEGKGYFNKGSGRIQFLHFFNKTEITSVYKSEKSATGFKQRIFSLSKSKAFLQNNAIIRVDDIKDISATEPFTILTFNTPLYDEDTLYYKSLTVDDIKNRIKDHYLAYFCENRDTLPKIVIQSYLNNISSGETEIVTNDIPGVDQQKEIDVYYSKITGNRITKTDNKEALNLKAFKIPKDDLDKNGLKLISKGEIAKDFTLDSLLDTDHIENNRYLFLLSGDYINNKDSDTRGELQIPKKADFKKNELSLFDEEEILMDDIEEKANEEIEKLYEEIKCNAEKKKKNIEELRKMFLLNDETIKSIRISINDSDDKILEKVYQADAKIIAKGDAEIKQQIKLLEELNPAEKDYEDIFKTQVDELVKAIPLQNRTALTHYVARRKLVLELFDKILENQLEIQKTSSRNIDEKLLHNLIFQQSSDNTEDSDLWLINEDFIYFKGVSESKLKDVKIDNEFIFKKEFEKEETEYLLSLGENRKIKKPDILLFPDESKCIIIELKNPDVPIRTHLGQIDFYAGLIRNLTKDTFNLDTFYGYLIGESIDPRDVRLTDQRFIQSYHLDYMFRPSTPVAGDIFPNTKKSDGSIYTEVIKYSTLLERALMRNKIFIDKITKPIKLH